MTNVVDVFAVYGDFGNVGGGVLIGISDDLNKAESISKGRGSLDCGGDGRVEERKAIKDGEGYYLLELSSPILINKELISRDQEISCSVFVTEINKPIEFMKLFRNETGASLKESMDLINMFRQYGKVQFHNMGRFDFSEKEASSLKEVFEKDGVAKIEIKFTDKLSE